MKNDLIRVMKHSVSVLNQYDSKKLCLYHHNDTDGLSSGAILLNAFIECGYDVSRYSLEKPYPQVLDKIFVQRNQVIVFADFAGKIAPLISNLNNGKNLVIIIDHHPAENVEDPLVFNLNGDLYGLKGDRDISASATSYLFAQQLLKDKGKDSNALSHLGTLGAIGDGFFVNGALGGVNREILRTAVKAELLRIEKTESCENYFITLGGVEYPALEICESLDTLGGVGYYDEGTSNGVDLCLNGVNDNHVNRIRLLKTEMRNIFSNELSNLKSNIQSTDHIQWFDVGDRFSPMGVKMIGVFCMYIKDMDFLDDNKYLAGFQNVPDRVPGFGKIDFDSSKISMRVSLKLS